ncbi:collagen-like protein, partial [Bacillus mycoides]|uniref:collagen-like protein n=1 Tax=Bacillus mycoides TaxID=1405 RepID=UPI00148568F4
GTPGLQGPPGTPGERGPTGPAGPGTPIATFNANKSTAQVVASGGTINDYLSGGGPNIDFNLATGIGTIQIRGIYLMLCTISVPPSTSQISFVISVNGATTGATFRIGILPNSSSSVFTVTGIVALNPNDTVQIINTSTTAVAIPRLSGDNSGVVPSNVNFQVYMLSVL